MGRKIPAKKHRGVKDPLDQQARRLQSLKCKINAPPAAEDDQPAPRSLARLFAPPAPRAPRPARPRPAADGARGNPVSSLRRLPAESGRAFGQRISGAVRALTAPAQHYPVETCEEEEGGARRARRRGGPAPSPRAAHPARARRRALKLKAKQEKADEVSLSSREVVYERVPFGARPPPPPALRGAPPGRRPAARPLLLTPLLAGAREEAVRAYRDLKASRRRVALVAETPVT